MSHSTDSGRVPLLGQLAAEGWFMSMGEVAATKSLAWLSSDSRLREAILENLGRRAGVDLTATDRFVPESVQDDLARPDIEMLDAEGNVVALVEAKFAAHLAVKQITAYLNVLDRRTGPHRGALFVLVPPSRVHEAQRIVETAFVDRPGDATAHAVISWDDWLAVWSEVASRDRDNHLADDLHQLTAMCRTLGGLVMPPLAGVATGVEWRTRAEDLVTGVRTVTAQFLGSDGAFRLPMQGNLVNKPWTYRYLPPIDRETWVQVGVWATFADEGLTPFWLMLHKDDQHTGGFRAALQRLMASDLSRRVRRDDGHAWVPLDVPADAAGPELVDSLATRIGGVLDVLRP